MMIPLLSVAAANCRWSYDDTLCRAGFAGLPSSAILAELDVAFGSFDRDRGTSRDAAPPTPPCIRGRTRRFD